MEHFPRAVLFDLDGTLVTSQLDFAKMKSDTGCPPDNDILAYQASLPHEDQARVARIIAQHEQEDAHQTQCIQGSLEVVNNLTKMGIKTAIVTRNSEHATRIKLERTQLKVDVILTREDAPPKPSPQGLLSIIQNWGIAPRDAIYVGDYLYDIQAAQRANMHSAYFCPGERPDYSQEADLIITHYDQFMNALTQYWKQQASN